MYDLAGVQVLHPPEYLVEEDLDVVRGQVLGGDDDLVQVRLHQLGDEVDFLEKVDVRRLKKREWSVFSKEESSTASSSLDCDKHHLSRKRLFGDSCGKTICK